MFSVVIKGSFDSAFRDLQMITIQQIFDLNLSIKTLSKFVVLMFFSQNVYWDRRKACSFEFRKNLK